MLLGRYFIPAVVRCAPLILPLRKEERRCLAMPGPCVVKRRPSSVFFFCCRSCLASVQHVFSQFVLYMFCASSSQSAPYGVLIAEACTLTTASVLAPHKLAFHRLTAVTVDSLSVPICTRYSQFSRRGQRCCFFFFLQDWQVKFSFALCTRISVPFF